MVMVDIIGRLVLLSPSWGFRTDRRFGGDGGFGGFDGGRLSVKRTSNGGVGLVWRVPVGAVFARLAMETVRWEVFEAVDRIEDAAVVVVAAVVRVVRVDTERWRETGVDGDGEGPGAKEKGLVRVEVGDVVVGVVAVVMLFSWRGGRVVRGLMGDVWESCRGFVVVGDR